MASNTREMGGKTCTQLEPGNQNVSNAERLAARSVGSRAARHVNETRFEIAQYTTLRHYD